ncbi:phage tail protein [Arthrobacter sp. 35W]|uniref:phage tail protein n=1 Tax=Arthrobacter sp. 35W TaxID=1132441 RepID=UPI0003FB1DBF|nr:tail fiber protein [Arthrobacter sp. 35W]
MSTDPFIGEISITGFNFAPRGWALCNGQLLSIAQNTALFSLLGTTYGGNGVNTFALPNLQGRVPIHQGQGPGLTPYVIGETGGVESVALNQTQIPQHVHSIPAAGAQTSDRPATLAPATGGVYGVASGVMAATGVAGSGQAHENRQPFLTLNYIIALQGVFPPRQ